MGPTVTRLVRDPLSVNTSTTDYIFTIQSFKSFKKHPLIFPGSESFNMDDKNIEFLPTIVNQEIESFGSIIESWLHYILTIFY